MLFKYRYVDFGTKFTKGEGVRSAENRAGDPSKLFANEIAMDVGGECWGYEECSLPVFDHHFFRPNQYASATIAVLDNAQTIRAAVGSQPLVWLVAHRDPDFDAFASMYAARVLLEEDIPALPWREIDHFNPDLSRIQKAHRWIALLGACASRVDNCHRITCRKERAIHSVLYAALQRGRDYQEEDSGAVEFFQQVRQEMAANSLNPLFDSVLEHNRVFAPELAMLDREVLAYERDVRRARKAAVHLCTAPFAEFFNEARETALEKRPAIFHQERRQTDGIYLRDPECILFKEWARLDTENSSMNEGFLFTAVAYSGERPGEVNGSNYFFSVDPERCAGRHLYDVWEHLERAELKALEKQTKLSQGLLEAENEAHQTGRTLARRGFEDRAGKHKHLFNDPWFDGSNYECTIVATPNRGTFIAPPGRKADLSDDEVTLLVVQCIEHGIYHGPVAVKDLAARPDLKDIIYDKHNIRTVIEQMRPPARGYFRLSSVVLEEHLDLEWGAMLPQIAAELWRILNPAVGRSLPSDFMERHVFWRMGWIAVWSREGVSIAYKGSARNRGEDLRELFERLIEFVKAANGFVESASKTKVTERLKEGEALICTSAQLTYELALPDHQVLQSFHQETRLSEVIKTLRDVQTAVAADQQRGAVAEGTHKMIELQKKVEVLEIVIVSFYATELMKTFSEHLGLLPGTALLVSFVGVVIVTGVVWNAMGRPHGLKPMILALGVLWVLALGSAYWLPENMRKLEPAEEILKFLQSQPPAPNPPAKP
ncbi:MAG TPA: hypothetical protein VGN17_07510 [Bryobacteraceae bacterium]